LAPLTRPAILAAAAVGVAAVLLLLVLLLVLLCQVFEAQQFHCLVC
jgi:hypothetical protein